MLNLLYRREEGGDLKGSLEGDPRITTGCWSGGMVFVVLVVLVVDDDDDSARKARKC